MSIFGESDRRENMNWLYDQIEIFFKDGGTIGDFFEVLEYYFKDKELKIDD